MKKHTLVIGASTNPERYSYKAATLLAQYGHPITLFGNSEGTVAGASIQTQAQAINDVDTITLYVNPANQREWYEYILAAKPKRVVFNPGTENPELQAQLQQHHIAFEEACTLVLLQTNQY